MIAEVSTDRLAEVLGLLVCPACRGPLHRGADVLHCGSCARDYPIKQGRPVFVDDPSTVRTMAEGHISNQPGDEVVDWLRRVNGWALNLGAGGSEIKLPNVVELEYSIFRHTDVSADAHRLPFRDAVFEVVVTFNTFEHLHDPQQAAREIYRVLKPGGKVLLQTAYMQPLHEAPYHYYNATEYGVRYWFAQFDIESVVVTPNFNPSYTLAWMTHELLYVVEKHLGAEARKQLEESPLKYWANIWGWTNTPKENGPVWDILHRLPPEAQARFAAGFQREARKPVLSPLRANGEG